MANSILDGKQYFRWQTVFLMANSILDGKK
jgi:hypothetical protein